MRNIVPSCTFVTLFYLLSTPPANFVHLSMKKLAQPLSYLGDLHRHSAWHCVKWWMKLLQSCESSFPACTIWKTLAAHKRKLTWSILFHRSLIFNHPLLKFQVLLQILQDICCFPAKSSAEKEKDSLVITSAVVIVLSNSSLKICSKTNYMLLC